MDILEESGFSPATGIYYSKWDSPPLPQSSVLSLPTFLLSVCNPHVSSSKPAFIDAKSGEKLTYGELRALVEVVAASLHSLGIGKGDVVLLVSPNFVEFPAVVLGIMSLGAVFSAANPLNTRQEIETQVRDSDAALILTTQELRGKLGGILSRPPVMVESLVLSSSEGASTGQPEVLQDDTASLMYSSGTTGKSKAVVGSHRNLIAMGCLLRHAWGTSGGGAAEEVYLCAVPLFHMFGLSVFVLGVLATGATAIILRRYALEDMLLAVDEFMVTRLPVVPPMVVQLTQAESAVKACGLGRLKEVMCSGAPLGRDHMERFALCFPHLTLTQCYGLTETNGPVTLCDGISGRFHVSIGRLLPSMDAKIVDIRTGKPLPPRQYGELYLRGPPVMQGYFNNPEATSFTIDTEGWLRTGDLCFIDAAGLVYLVDRIKELIKYKAYQVAPAELEEILITHPEVADAAVISQPHTESGEIPVACVVRTAESKLREADIISFIAAKVAPYKKIRKVVFVESIPRSASGKILRRFLKASTSIRRQEITPKL